MRGCREGLVELGTGEAGVLGDVGVTCARCEDGTGDDGDGDDGDGDGVEGVLHSFARF